jgi:hypothetical protein
MQLSVPSSYVAGELGVATFSSYQVQSGSFSGPIVHGFSIAGYPGSINVVSTGGPDYAAVPDPLTVNISSDTEPVGTYAISLSYGNTGTPGADYATEFSWAGPQPTTTTGTGPSGC